MLDANATIDKAAIQSLITSCAFHDLHSSNPSPSTFICSQNRINFTFGCATVQISLRRSGTLLSYDCPQFDHRGLFMDLDLDARLGYCPQPIQFPSPASQLLNQAIRSWSPNMQQAFTDTIRLTT